MSVIILDKDRTVGDWLLKQLDQIHISAKWLPTATDLLAESEHDAPIVCLVALRQPLAQALTLITDLTQEPRFAKTAFILMGPDHYKHAAFKAGADDYLTTPPDVIELRKRIRLYLDRAALEARVITETRITQEMDAISDILNLTDTSRQTSLFEHITALTRERNQYEMILAYTAEAISFVALDGTLLYANPTWEALIGSHLNARAGERIAWPPITNSPTVNQSIANAIERELPWQGEVDIELPDNAQLHLAMNIQPAFHANNKLAGFVITQQNIAERRALEAAKARFFSEIAYEMRTPVTNLKMRQYLLSQAPADQRAQHLHILERDTEHLVQLVESMLELSRLDTGTTELNCQPIDLNRVVSEALIRYGPSAENKGVTLTIERDESLPSIDADPVQLARALGILIDNAIQHTPANGHILIRPVPEAWSGGSFLTLQVTDTGTGITLDAQPYIFDRFFRGAYTIEAGIQGTGLGLSIAQEIVTRHNGHITVESEVDRGSTFTIWLPLEVAG
ncbi:MAG: PAS domain-containing protein [Anaerolineae bacterium]|nr:PAS domain-containing protein [Anaerolineae bacterium]